MGNAKRSGPSLREQWRETTNREAFFLLPLLGATLGVVYYASLFTGFFGLGWWAVLLLGAALTVACVVALSFSVGYRPAPVGDPAIGRTGSLWHISSAPALMGAEKGDVITLDVGHCRALARMWDRSRAWGPPRRAVYFFDAPPTLAAAGANVSGRRRRDAVLLELEPSGVREPCYRRGGAIASTAGYRGCAVSVTRFDEASTSGDHP